MVQIGSKELDAAVGRGWENSKGNRLSGVKAVTKKSDFTP
jgi:hypothetical protein